MTQPNRLSAGLLAEHLGASRLVLNLDLFYSLAASPADGPGLILAAWYRL